MKRIKNINESNTPVDGIYLYIQDLKKFDTDGASHVKYGENGFAEFWYDYEAKGYKLVLGSNPEETKFWGDEELSEVNDIKLTATQLYGELKSLPKVNLKNFYGLNDVFNEFGREKYRT